MREHVVTVGGKQHVVKRDADGKFIMPDELAWIKGHSVALKPAFEPIVLARKPLSEKTVAANVLRWRTGALNIDACRVPCTDVGGRPKIISKSEKSLNTFGDGLNGSRAEGTTSDARWPANVVHDGSDEVVGAFPQSSGSGASYKRGVRAEGEWLHAKEAGTNQIGYADGGGSAARFFYSAKASKADRAGSKHPTVKPVALMEWLATLITPPGGTILDPFAGSGTTGAAARNKGFACVLIEREDEYVADIKRRLTLPVATAQAVQAANDNNPCPEPDKYDRGECCGGACLTEVQLDIFGRAA